MYYSIFICTGLCLLGNISAFVFSLYIEHDSLSLSMLRCVAEMVTVIRQNLNVEGLFRVSGSAVRMKDIRAVINNGGTAAGFVHDIAGILKAFLRYFIPALACT